MRRTKIEVGETYAFSRYSSRPQPLRITLVTGSRITGVFLNGAGKPAAPSIMIRPANLLRTWAEQVAAEAAEAAERATREEIYAARVAELHSLVPASALVDLRLPSVHGRPLHLTVEQLLAIVKAARTEALDEAAGFGGRHNRGY